MKGIDGTPHLRGMSPPLSPEGVERKEEKKDVQKSLVANSGLYSCCPSPLPRAAMTETEVAVPAAAAGSWSISASAGLMQPSSRRAPSSRRRRRAEMSAWTSF
jgi:hypothetical protein